MPSIKQGATGPFIARIQSALTARGFNPGEVDGIFGPATLRAVRRFQGQQGLTVDGCVGRNTLVALGLPPPWGSGGGGGWGDDDADDLDDD